MDPELLAIRKERAKLLAETLATEAGIPVGCVFGKSRDPEVVAVRHRLWAMLFDSGLSILAVATVVGVDHCSVIYVLKKVLGVEAYKAALRERARKPVAKAPEIITEPERGAA
jgi:hypothetical protein